MVPRSSLVVFLVLSLAISAQDTSRNLAFPTQTSTTPVATTSAAVSGARAQPSASPVTNSTGNIGSSNSNNSSLIPSGSIQNGTSGTGTSTATTPLASIADSTGGVNVPVPAATGGKPSGRFGPDDQYFAAATQIVIPLLTSLAFVMVSILIGTQFP